MSSSATTDETFPASGKGPLAGHRILVTGPKGAAGGTADCLHRRGAEPIERPLLELWVDVTAVENTLEGTIVAMEDWARTSLPHPPDPGKLSLGPALLHPAYRRQPHIKSRD